MEEMSSSIIRAAGRDGCAAAATPLASAFINRHPELDCSQRPAACRSLDA
jgi:hypothetical protein